MIGRECADSYSTPKQVIYDSNLISLWGQKKRKKSVLQLLQKISVGQAIGNR